jgi:hypothetical protein
MVSSTGDQDLAVELQKFESAFIQVESSILPAFINLISGFSLTKEINGEPHSAQKPLDILEPAEPVTV